MQLELLLVRQLVLWNDQPNHASKAERHPLASDPSNIIMFGVLHSRRYQGESNIGASSMYKCQLQAIVADLRLSFGQPDLPFLVVQLCPVGLATPDYHWIAAHRQYDAQQVDSMRRSSAFLRLAQELALTLPNTALAITADLGIVMLHLGTFIPETNVK